MQAHKHMQFISIHIATEFHKKLHLLITFEYCVCTQILYQSKMFPFDVSQGKCNYNTI